MTFSNIAQLKAFLTAACTDAVVEVEDKVYGTIDANLNQFYGEFSPSMYVRTGALSGSLQRTGVVSTGSGASAEVYFTTPGYSTGTWDGGTVLGVALEGALPHGGYAGGTPIWSASMAELGDIESLLLNAVKARV